MMRTTTLAVALGAIIALAGCATSNTEMVAKAISSKPQSSCQLPLGPDGELVDVTGEACDRAVSLFAKAARSSACADFAQDNENVCMLLATFGDKLSGDDGYQNTDVQLLIAAMQEDGKDRRQIRGILANFGIVGVQETGATIRNSSNNKTTRALYKAFGGPSGDINITKSDDGGGEGEGAGGRGGDGDQTIYIGDNNQGINRSEGSAASKGRNPAFLGLNHPDSSFETSNQNESAPGSTIENAPAVRTSDDDGENSVIPGI